MSRRGRFTSASGKEARRKAQATFDQDKGLSRVRKIRAAEEKRIVAAKLRGETPK